MQDMVQRLLRRPLCLFVLSYAVVSFVIQIFAPSTPSGAAALEYEKVSLTGQLKKKEKKNGHQIYYLKHIQIQIIENQNFKQKSKQNFNLRKEKTEKEAVCYMASESEGALPMDGSSALSEIPVGRWLYVCGEVMASEAAENDGQFDAKAYDESLGVSVRLWDTKVLQQGNTRNAVDDTMVNIKYKLSQKFHAYLGEENAGVLCAMLLGDKTSMVVEIKNLYRKSGIAHVLAISGLHISLLGMLLYRFLRRCYLPPFLCSVLGIVGVVVYIRFVGASVSSLRAVCMFVLYMLADLFGRTYDLLTALACSAFLLLVQKPSAMFEAGFLLSYFAVLGLALVFPVLSAQVNRIHAVSAFLPGFSVQVLIFPITLWFYYEFPLYSFLLNLFVVPCMSVVLVSAMIGTLPGMGFVLYLTGFLLESYEWLCRLTEQLPGAVIVTGRPKRWQMVLYYAAIVIWLVVSRRLRRSTEDEENDKDGEIDSGSACPLWRRVAYILFPLFCMAIFLLPVHRENRLDMLSVGQGDCICLRDASGRVVLVDGGSTDVSQVGTYRLLPFLKYHGISRVDAIFLSHAHEDHYSAIVELLKQGGKEGVHVRSLCLPDTAGNSYGEIIALADRAACEVVWVKPGDHITCGQMKIDCVYPPADTAAKDENDNSMVLLARMKDFSVLFTGDSSAACDGEVIRRLSDMGVQEIDCLKVAHHGAQTSTSRELLERFKFDLALISCGEGNSYGHPHEPLLRRLSDAGCKVFVTAESGQITVKIGDGKVNVRGFR